METLTIIIPAYNEASRIGKTIKSYCADFPRSKILVVVNGSDDKTFSIVKKYSKKFRNLKYLNFKDPIGKGGAIIEGFNASNTELIGFVDADGSTPTESYKDLVKNINGYDGIIASRWSKGSMVSRKQPILRRVSSRLFNAFVRVLFRIKLKDTQCGAKLFRKKAIKSIINYIGITTWAFDIDLLYNLIEKNYTVIEIPTKWNDSSGSQLNLIKTIPEMFFSVLRLRLMHSPFKSLLYFISPIEKVVWRLLR